MKLFVNWSFIPKPFNEGVILHLNKGKLGEMVNLKYK